MKDNSNSKEQKPNLYINLISKVRNDLMNSKININEKSDLNKIALETILNEKLINFGGDYYNKLYEKAEREEIKEKNGKPTKKQSELIYYKYKNNSDLFQIDEVEYNEKQNIKLSKRTTKSDNSINISKLSNKQILNNNTFKSNHTNPIFKVKKIFFEVKFETRMGQSISVIGSIDKLGNWNESKALNMNWNEGNIWKANMEFENIKGFEYKFIFMENGAIKQWEDGINRIFSLNQIRNLLEPNLIYGNFIKLNNILNQSIEYNYDDYSSTIISEWNKKEM